MADLPHAFPTLPHTSSMQFGVPALHDTSNVGIVPQAQGNSCKTTSPSGTGTNVPKFRRQLGRLTQDKVRMSSMRSVSSSHNSIDPLLRIVDGFKFEGGRRKDKTQCSIPKSIVLNWTMV